MNLSFLREMDFSSVIFFPNKKAKEKKEDEYEYDVVKKK